MSPNDLGVFGITGGYQKILINEYVARAKKQVIESLVRSYCEIDSVAVEVVTTNSAFKGKRLWFLCPICGKRRGKLYKSVLNGLIGCRRCEKL